MKEFHIGPFLFRSEERKQNISGSLVRRWTMHYACEELGWQHAPDAATQREIVALFEQERSGFVVENREAHAPDVLRLTDADGETLARVAVNTLPDGMSGCIPDDRFPFWLLTASKPTLGMPITLSEFARFAVQYTAPANSWIAGLLPDKVLSDDAETWRAPTAWEIRHVVGEGSFTGVTGAQAAALVGVTPQNFRKYTAADGASTRQSMSFAMWHLLLHRLGVKRAPGAAL